MCFQQFLYKMDNSVKDSNRKIRRNTVAFGIMMIIAQAGMVTAYSLCFQIKTSTLNISSIVNAIALSILVIGGFGMVFSYLKRLIWSGIGFTFLITAFCIELYPLVNDFWVKTAIIPSNSSINFQTTSYQLYLSNVNMPSNQIYGNCITNAIKCALAVAAAFSSILGRAGPLQCFITIIFGTIGFELNRQVLVNLSVDCFGTYTIFTFGGFMGLALGVILKFKEDKSEECSTEQHAFNTSSQFNALYSLFGSLIIFALFPILAYEIDLNNNVNLFSYVNDPTSIILGMGAAVIGALCISALINGNLILRDIIHAPIAGGIVVGSASMFIANPLYAMVAGFTAGIVQSLIQNVIEKNYMKSKSVVSTISWSLFGVQGLIGGVFATGYKNIIDNYSNGINYSNSASINYNPGYQLLIAVIAAGIGLGFGILAGIIIYLVSAHRKQNHFTDRSYWMSDNGISFAKPKKVEAINLPTETPAIPKQAQKVGQAEVREQHSQILPNIIPDVIIPMDESDIQFQFQMEFSQNSEMQNDYHAYL